MSPRRGFRQQTAVADRETTGGCVQLPSASRRGAGASASRGGLGWPLIDFMGFTKTYQIHFARSTPCRAASQRPGLCGRRLPVTDTAHRRVIDQFRAGLSGEPSLCTASAGHRIGFACATRLMSRRQNQSGMIPKTPNEQSINRQPNGIPRTLPITSANGTTRAQAILPNSTTQTSFTGSRHGPTNAIAMTKWANASQSVP